MLETLKNRTENIMSKVKENADKLENTFEEVSRKVSEKAENVNNIINDVGEKTLKLNEQIREQVVDLGTNIYDNVETVNKAIEDTGEKTIDLSGKIYNKVKDIDGETPQIVKPYLQIAGERKKKITRKLKSKMNKIKRLIKTFKKKMNEHKTVIHKQGGTIDKSKTLQELTNMDFHNENSHGLEHIPSTASTQEVFVDNSNIHNKIHPHYNYSPVVASPDAVLLSTSPATDMNVDLEIDAAAKALKEFRNMNQDEIDTIRKRKNPSIRRANFNRPKNLNGIRKNHRALTKPPKNAEGLFYCTKGCLKTFTHAPASIAHVKCCKFEPVTSSLNKND